MSADHLCPNCQEPVKPDWSLCPHCGQSNPVKVGKIRCRVCGRSAKGTLYTCPHCGAYLEAKPFPVLQLSVSALVLVGLVLGVMQLWPTLSGCTTTRGGHGQSTNIHSYSDFYLNCDSYLYPNSHLHAHRYGYGNRDAYVNTYAY